MFRRLGFDIRTDVSLPSGKNVDFEVVSPSGHAVFVEATVSHGDSRLANKYASRDRLIDELRPLLQDLHVGIWVHSIIQGKTAASPRRLATAIQNYVKTSSQVTFLEETQLVEDEVSSQIITDPASGWGLDCSFVQIGDEKSEHHHPFVAVSGDAEWIDGDILRHEVRTKLKQSRNAIRQVVVAVAFNDGVSAPSEHQIINNLAGSLKVRIPIANLRSDSQTASSFRSADGVWTAPRRSAAANCPAVITCFRVLDLILLGHAPTLWLNPYMSMLLLKAEWPFGLRSWTHPEGTLARSLARKGVEFWS